MVSWFNFLIAYINHKHKKTLDSEHKRHVRAQRLFYFVG